MGTGHRFLTTFYPVGVMGIFSKLFGRQNEPPPMMQGPGATDVAAARYAPDPWAGEPVAADSSAAEVLPAAPSSEGESPLDLELAEGFGEFAVEPPEVAADPEAKVHTETETEPDPASAPEPKPSDVRGGTPAEDGSWGDVVDNILGDLIGPGREAEPAPTDGPGEPGAVEDPAETTDVAAGAGLDAQASAEMREMFASIAAGYVRPVRQFIGRLGSGSVSSDWVEVCLPAVEMVRRSAAGMGLTEFLPLFERFETQLREAGDAERPVEGAARDRLLAIATELAEALPETFTPDASEDQRDSVILHALLRQVPDLGRVSLDRIFGAGLTSIEMLERANAVDLEATTGLPARLAERVCEAVSCYVSERRDRETWASSEPWLELLNARLTELWENHERLEESGDTPDEIRERKQFRRARQLAALQIDTFLAEMGELALVDEIQRLPFERRIERIDAFLGALRGRLSGGTSSDGGFPEE